MERKKVLIMSDSPKLHTGFAKVTKEIWTNLNRTGSMISNALDGSIKTQQKK